jgi:EAL domain-containing protein (putative c-di-GMP-specific phosphodiesterase class I)
MQAIRLGGRALGLHATAEGIENKEVLKQLMKLGCDTGQASFSASRNSGGRERHPA